MLYYRIRGEVINKEQTNTENQKNSREETRRIREKTVKFNENTKDYLFIESLYDADLLAGAVIEDGKDLEKRIEKYFAFIELDIEIINIVEITFQEFCDSLENADCNSYITHTRSALEKYGVKNFRTNYGESFNREIIINTDSKENIFELADELSIRESLIPELKRIQDGKSKTKAEGHPVHYIIESDDRYTTQNAYMLLAIQLHKYGRIKSRRIAFIDHFKDVFAFRQLSMDDMYRVNNGGIMFVNLKANTTDGEIVNSDRRDIERICSAVKRFSDQVLTIIHLPKECTKIKDILFEYLGSMSFVELKEEFVSSDEAKGILKRKAKEKHVRSDKILMNYIDESKTYLIKDLNDNFDEWYRDKLKRSVYPQYKNINMIKKTDAESKNKGKAYDTLNEMIGLIEAKKVINQALDFYKAKKLFESKGICQNNPSMHMVFTGNPGTAKTTVARLFAEIMRDNKVLSEGNLVEVGRSDLVGQYVGWTAPTVKRKFQEAKGGVLFIDEAYSLVDDRDGLYGDEAINTIVQEMENHRNELVVIFAGYPDKMESFLQKNPGLRSRIAFHVPFIDYNVDELCEIAKNIASQKGLYLADSAVKQLRNNFEIVINYPDFGNGRYVRNLIEKAVMTQASRLLKMDYNSISAADVKTICGEDIDIPAEEKNEKIKFGFC